MDGSTIGLLVAGLASAAFGVAIWSALRGMGEAFELVTDDRHLEHREIEL